MTTDLKIACICPSCGSTDVRVDAWAEFDIDSGRWVLSDTYDDQSWCENCQGETKLREVPFGNCMSPSQRISYKALVVSPVRNMSTNEEETDMTVCIAADAQIWTVYGVTEDGTSEALHDEEHAEDAATALLRFSEALGNLPVIFACAEHRVPEGPFAELTDLLAEIIHDEIPGYDDPEDFRDDDFDNHPLAALREAVVELTQG